MHCDWSNPVHFKSTMSAAYFTRVYDISTFIKNWFPAFSLARRSQVISSYICTTKYGQWTHQQKKKAEYKISLEAGGH